MSSQNTNTQNPSPFRDGVSPQHAHNPSPFRDGVSKLDTARLLYMAGDTTQKGIAKQVNVSERTVYTWIKENHWDKLRQAARSAPAVIAENMFSQLVELQNDIAGREVGKRYPTMQEAELTRKLCLSIDRMKSAPGLSQSMQVLQLFRTFAQTHYDTQFHLRLNQVIEHFLEGNAKNGFMPYQIEYGCEIDSISENTETQENVEESAANDTICAHSTSPAPSGRDGEGLHTNSSGPTSDIKPAPAKTGSKTEVNPPQNPANTSIPPFSNPTGSSSNTASAQHSEDYARAS